MNGTVVPTPFLNISDRVLAGGERGLLNITFPPQPFPSDHFYVNYTRRPGGATVVARYRLTADPNVGDPASEEVLLVVSQPFANHNGGMMAFSPVDRFLYIPLGMGARRVIPEILPRTSILAPAIGIFLGRSFASTLSPVPLHMLFQPLTRLFSGPRAKYGPGVSGIPGDFPSTA
jgi:hypothetical protein